MATFRDWSAPALPVRLRHHVAARPFNDNAGALHSVITMLRSPRGGDVAALVLGAVLPLAFAPLDVWPVAVLAPAGLFLLWRECGPRAGFRRGWLFGFGMWGGGVYWIYHSLHLFGDAIAPIAALLTALFVAAMALTLGVLGWLVCRVDPARRKAVWLLVTLPSAWVALEWVRSWLLTGFPWLLLGTGALDTWLAGYLPVIGVYGAGLVLALTAAALAAAVAVPTARRAALVLGIGLVLVWGGGLGLNGRAWTRPAGPPVDVALLQGNIEQSQKFGTLMGTLRHYMDSTRDIAGEVGIVIWPETAVPTFYSRVDERLDAFAREMAAQGTEVVTGIFIYEEASGRYYNSVRPLGEGRRDYRKQHLVPFGEYMPLRGLLRFAEQYIRIPMSDIASGEPDQAPLAVGGYAMAASVCYEAAYPETIRSLARGSDMLVNVSNDAWFGDSSAPSQHLQLARMRSLETGRPMLRATNTGISAVIDEQGDVVATAPQFEVGLVRATVQPYWGETPWMRWGSVPVLILIVLMLLSPPVVSRLRSRAST